MICKKCGHINALTKKTCNYCGAILEGYTLNNVTGEYGYRGGDGYFYKTKDDYEAAFRNQKVKSPSSALDLEKWDHEAEDAVQNT